MFQTDFDRSSSNYLQHLVFRTNMMQVVQYVVLRSYIKDPIISRNIDSTACNTPNGRVHSERRWEDPSQTNQFENKITGQW